MTYCELSGSHREGISDGGGNTAERIFLTTWANRIALAEALCEGDDKFASKWPALASCRIQSFAIQPFSQSLVTSGVVSDPGTQLPNYETGGKPAAIVRATYGPAFDGKAWPTDITKPEVREGTVLRLRARGSGQFLTIPARMLKWEPSSPGETADDNPVPPDIGAALVIPATEYNVQWDFIDDPPLLRLENLVGAVDVGGLFGAEEETILFEGYDLDDAFKCYPQSPNTYRVNLTFRKRRIVDGDNVYGWNHDFREEPAGWTRILMANGKPRYRTEDMTEMFE